MYVVCVLCVDNRLNFPDMHSCIVLRKNAFQTTHFFKKKYRASKMRQKANTAKGVKIELLCLSLQPVDCLENAVGEETSSAHFIE